MQPAFNSLQKDNLRAYMSHQFEISVKKIPASQEEQPEPLTFFVTNHDDILRVVNAVKAAGKIPAEESDEFAVGLKLFGEVVLRHRKDELFADFYPHFLNFMKRLKS